MNSLKKAVILVFFCCTSALFGMDNKTVWSLEDIEKNKSTIFWNKTTDESKSAAVYLIKQLDEWSTREETVELLKKFTTLELQTLLGSIKKHAEDNEKTIKETKNKLTQMFIKTCGVTVQKANAIIDYILLVIDTNTIRYLDDDYIQRYATAYFQQLPSLAPADMQAAVECAAIASQPELFKEDRLQKLQETVGQQTVLAMFKCAIPGFFKIASRPKLPNTANPLAVKLAISNKKNMIKEYTKKMSFLGHPGLIYWIIREQEPKNQTKHRTSIHPDQFVYNVPIDMLKKIFADIKKKDAIALAKMLSNKCIANYFDSIPTALTSDIDLIIACAKGLLGAKQHKQKLVMTIACACGAVLETGNTLRITAVKELLEKLNIEEATILLDSTDKKNNPSLYKKLFNNLSACNQEVLTPQTKKVLLMDNRWFDKSLRWGINPTRYLRTRDTDLKNALQIPEEKQVIALLKKITQPIACSITINVQDKKPIKVKLVQPKQINFEAIQEPVTNNTSKKSAQEVSKKQLVIKKPADSSRNSALPGLFSGLALTYAFFNWKSWGDIKNRNVFLPLAAGIFPALYTNKTYGQKSLYYGPLIGSLARLFVQIQKEGGFTNFAQRSYRGTKKTDRDMVIANIGAVTGFLSGLFDLNFINTIVNPLQALWNKQTPTGQKIPTKKAIATTGCYIVKTGISMLSPAYERLVETAGYVGKTTRVMLQKVGLFTEPVKHCPV